MNSGKSIEILKVTHNYEEQNKHILWMISAIDNRDGIGTIASRIGIKHDAIAISVDDNIYNIVCSLNQKISCILIDEAQFLKKHHIVELTYIVDDLNTPVMAFGLK